MRADVFGILQKVSRGGEVVGRNGPRSRATVLHICNSQDVYRTWLTSSRSRYPLLTAQFFALRNRIMHFTRPVPDESARGHARMTRRDRRHQRAGGCRNTDYVAQVAQLQDLLDPADLYTS